MTNSFQFSPRCRRLLALSGAVVLGSMLGNEGFAADGPVASGAYSLSVFAKAPAGLSKPDSIAIVKGNVWIGYGNTGKKDGADGAVSQIVEYTEGGKILKTFKITGHNDGIKLNPVTGKVWAMQNEDGNPTLIVIDPATDKLESYALPPAGHGGGYDDVVFKNGEAFLTASAPDTDGGKTNPGPSVVRVAIGAGGKVTVEPVFPGAPTVTDMVSGKTETLNLTDPDFITLAPNGDMVMTSQDDGELIYIQAASAKAPKGKVLHLLNQVKVDDTTFVTASRGFLLVGRHRCGYRLEGHRTAMERRFGVFRNERRRCDEDRQGASWLSWGSQREERRAEADRCRDEGAPRLGVRGNTMKV